MIHNISIDRNINDAIKKKNNKQTHSFYWLRYRCGDSQRFFYMEVGRHSAIGAGELYMETEDPLIAQNMHTTIIK